MPTTNDNEPELAQTLTPASPLVPQTGEQLSDTLQPTQAMPSGDGSPTIPGYEILGELGRGGMGVVYKARHLKSNRLVALKMVLSGTHAGREELRRFQSEAEAVARLQHPHIVQVFDVGEHEGRPYFSLEFCSGGSLEKKLSGTPLKAEEAAALVEQLARAMQVAHSAHIVHRDLKPANILIADCGLQIADSSGQSAIRNPQSAIPKITDFGLAKKLDEESGQTKSGAILGTPSYMAPEQAEGKKTVGPLADVYALGAILYDCLTGRPPFRAATVMDTLTQVLGQEPVAPRVLNARVPTDLETICLKCLHKEPEKRYVSAEKLAEDLRRFQAGEPIEARPVGRLERGWRWCRRNPVVAALLACVAVIVVTAGGLIAWQWRSAVAALKLAREEKQARALSQVHALRDAAPGAVPALLQELDADRATVLPRLRELWQEERDRARQMRVALALLPVESEALREQLLAWLLETPDPAEAVLIRAALQPHGAALSEGLWSKAGDDNAKAAERFRCLVALAAFAPQDERWPKRADLAVAEMLKANPLHLGVWVQALKPVGPTLSGPLGKVYRAEKSPERRELAATVLADYAAEQGAFLTDLLLDADPKQYAVLFPVVQRFREQTVEQIRREIARPASVPPEEKEQLARRQATGAVTLLKMDAPADAWPLYRHRADPEVRSQLIWRGGLLGLDPLQLVRRLDEEKDVTAQRALVLALGEFTAEQLPADVRGPLVEKLLKLYRDHPDPGLHAAIDWLLRHAKEGPIDRPLDWGQSATLKQIDDELKQRDSASPQRWYVNGQGQTMVLIPGPVEFHMGSPLSDPDRRDDETPHRRRIPRSFAIGARSISVEEFQRFLKDRPDVRHQYTKRYSPVPDGPIIALTWFEAAQYCNWLSEKEGIPEKEWCYPKHADIKEGMKFFPDLLQRQGYRLPTEAEWEFAARAGATTTRCYGHSLELLPRYAWFIQNSRERAWPVGQKRPNDFGLFDVHGNVWSWIQDAAVYPPKDQHNPLILDIFDSKYADDRPGRVLRGTSFDAPPAYARTAYRDDVRSTGRYDSIGLRVARTCKNGNEQEKPK